MVLVEATVRDDKGRIADDLKREDFRVFEDGVEQQIIYFSRDELPLAVALVVDGSSSISPVLRELHHAAYDTLSQLKPEDQVALYAFAAHPERLVDLTTDRKSIADSIMGIGSTGGTNIADALHEAIDYLGQEARDRRHAVIMISDNQPTSKGEFSGDDVIRLALETQTIVYSVRFGRDRLEGTIGRAGLDSWRALGQQNHARNGRRDNRYGCRGIGAKGDGRRHRAAETALYTRLPEF